MQVDYSDNNEKINGIDAFFALKQVILGVIIMKIVGIVAFLP